VAKRLGQYETTKDGIKMLTGKQTKGQTDGIVNS